MLRFWLLLGAAVVVANFATAGATTKPEAAQPSIGDRGLLSLAMNPTAAPPGTMLDVEVHAADLVAAEAVVASFGGTTHGQVPGWFIEAAVPTDALPDIAEHPSIDRVSPITETIRGDDAAFQAGEALVQTVNETLQMQAWHEAGHTGAGQRIGILDTFGDAEFNNARSNGRLPAPRGTFCLRNGTTCPITTGQAIAHGVGVAEIVHRTAPDADLYLATVRSTADLSAAVDWFISNGVTVINRSETSVLDGPGDGTGPVNSILDRAIAADIVFVSAAGNSAGGNGFRGQNWVGAFNDPDADGIHEWQNGSERMEFDCGFILGMRWDDWNNGQIATDYDLWIFDEFDDELPESRANDAQANSEHPPLEQVSTVCNFIGDVDYLSIVKFDDLEPDGIDQIQILGNFTPMEEWTNTFSATGPGADSANPGALTVGATSQPSSLSIASYSSQGPTFDGRVTPDLLGPSCLPVTNFVGCFTGTSAASPFVAGAVAILRAASVFDAATEIEALLPQITVDQGVPGIDNQYGVGTLVMPPPSALGVLRADQLCNGLVPTISGTDGSDRLLGTDGPDVILAGDGDDVIFGRGGGDTICGGPGRDRIKAGRGADFIDGGDQRDRIWGEAGADTILGGTGADRIVGNNGNDTVDAAGGSDRIFGGPGDDNLRGGSGNDRIEGQAGVDSITGGNGTDSCAGATAGWPNDAGDRLSRCE
jgi:Ca2+-binding RTX toxin-like protein